MTNNPLQGLLGGLLLLCIFVTIKLVPLGNASAIFFCTPVFTFVFAVCMLGERMGAYRVAISTVMLAGVLLITHPPFVFGKNMLMTDREVR
jgi:drug/metabolite transporter (DMT)-like permease